MEPKGAEVLPGKVRIKTRRRQPIRINHLQAAANNTKSGAKVHISVYSFTMGISVYSKFIYLLSEL